MNAPPVYAATVYFSGRVQGVGFRYTVLQLARGYEVTGYVENLLDGRVLLVAEGVESEVTGFVSAIEERLLGFIRQTERSGSHGPRRHQDFGIR